MCREQDRNKNPTNNSTGKNQQTLSPQSSQESIVIMSELLPPVQCESESEEKQDLDLSQSD